MVRFILGIAMSLLCVILFIQNSEIVQVNFLFWTFEMSRFLLLLMMLITGFVLGWGITNLGRKRKTTKK